jgi:hypothetical protein
MQVGERIHARLGVGDTQAFALIADSQCTKVFQQEWLGVTVSNVKCSWRPDGHPVGQLGIKPCLPIPQTYHRIHLHPQLVAAFDLGDQ